MADTNKLFVAIILAIVVIGGLGLYAIFRPASTNQSVIGGTGNAVVTAGCSQSPDYSFSAKDTQSTTKIGGTDEIKVGTLSPDTNPKLEAGKPLQYWKDNSSYFVDIANSPAIECGTHSVQANAYAYASSSLKVFDTDNNVFLTNGGGANITLGANQQSNLELRIQGTSKFSSAPFGGCIAVEYPSTLTQVTLVGTGLTGNACPYTWTYTSQSTGNSYKLLELTKDFDKDASGITKTMTLQLKAGSSNPSGMIYLTLQPANNYVGNDGSFYLGIEKDKNQDTTKTFGSAQTFSFMME